MSGLSSTPPVNQLINLLNKNTEAQPWIPLQFNFERIPPSMCCSHAIWYIYKQIYNIYILITKFSGSTNRLHGRFCFDNHNVCV